MTEAEKPKKTAYEQLNSRAASSWTSSCRATRQTDAVRAISKKWTRPDHKGSKWRKEKLVQQAIEERQAEAMEDAGITNAQILLGIAQMANVNVKALVWCDGETLPEGAKVGQPKKLHELDDVTARCIQSIEYSKDGELKVRFPIAWRRRSCSASTSACSPRATRSTWARRRSSSSSRRAGIGRASRRQDDEARHVGPPAAGGFDPLSVEPLTAGGGHRSPRTRSPSGARSPRSSCGISSAWTRTSGSCRRCASSRIPISPSAASRCRPAQVPASRPCSPGSAGTS
jgi:hypothetical protein